jgi:glutamine synthetase
MSSWSTGYGDFVLVPDLSTMRRIPWIDGTALVLADLQWHDGSPVLASPRQILERQVQRLAERDMVAMVGTELEFIVFEDSYEQAWDSGYTDLTPANRYNVDYSLLGGTKVEPLLRAIRRGMDGAGMTVESVKGECNLGQHEIAFKYDHAMTSCDHHVLYKNGAKEIASDFGCSLTFMAKYDQREGNSCHIHLSFRGDDGSAVMADDAGRFGMSALGEAFVAGQQARMRELTLLFAPNINSYKRYQPGTFAPTAIKWGRDNRTCALRLVGHGHGLRLENRVPGGDVNPYLAVAGMIAAGLDGIDRGLTLEEPFEGNAYAVETDHVPDSLVSAKDLWVDSAWINETFGDEVQAHYANMAHVELAAFGAAVTDWERRRGFERM